MIMTSYEQEQENIKEEKDNKLDDSNESSSSSSLPKTKTTTTTNITQSPSTIINNNNNLQVSLSSSSSSSSFSNNNNTNGVNSSVKKLNSNRKYFKKNENLNQNKTTSSTNSSNTNSPNLGSTRKMTTTTTTTNTTKEQQQQQQQINRKSIDLNKDDGYEDDDNEDDEIDRVSSSNNDNNNDENSPPTSPNNDSTNNEPLDPRIHDELERLNKASSDINRIENELEEAKSLFVSTKNRQAQRLEFLQKKLGSCISKSKPYYEAIQQRDKLQKETQKAVHEFQKAISHYKAAKETFAVAEQTLSSSGISDAWQEYLSEAITKINNSKRAADLAEEYHRNKAIEYQMCEKRLQYLENDLKRNIEKSKYYYEEKERWQMQMEAQKLTIYELERALNDAKKVYSEAMNALRIISEEIHSNRRTRKMRYKEREPCIGSDKPEDLISEYNERSSETTTKTTVNREMLSTNNEPSMMQVSRSLDNIRITNDSTDETNSLDTVSNASGGLNNKDSMGGLHERRQHFANAVHNQIEYYSFGAANSEPSSRCSSPSTNNNTNDNNFTTTDTNQQTTSNTTNANSISTRIIIGESNEDLSETSSMKTTDRIKYFLNALTGNNNNNDSGKFSFESTNSSLTKTPQQTPTTFLTQPKYLSQNLLQTNPKLINASSSSNSLESSTATSSATTITNSNRLPATPPVKPKKSSQQETPLLTNLLLFNNKINTPSTGTIITRSDSQRQSTNK